MNCSMPGFPVLHYLPEFVQIHAQMVKSLPARQETWVRSLSWEDPLKKGMATHSVILAWRIPRIEEPGKSQTQLRE